MFEGGIPSEHSGTGVRDPIEDTGMLVKFRSVTLADLPEAPTRCIPQEVRSSAADGLNACSIHSDQ